MRNTTTSGLNTAATENAAKLCRANSIAAIHWSACKRSVYSALARPNGAICRNWSANALRSNHGAPKPWWRRTYAASMASFITTTASSSQKITRMSPLAHAPTPTSTVRSSEVPTVT